jgi:mRNA interferase MazF
LNQNLGHIKKGDVVNVLFPYSNHIDVESETSENENEAQSTAPKIEKTAKLDNKTKSKDRPALVLFKSGSDNFVFCAITTNGSREPRIELNDKDFQTGSLTCKPSFIKPNILSTIDKSLIRSKVGTLKPEKLKEVITKLKDFLDAEPEEATTSKALQRPSRRTLR